MGILDLLRGAADQLDFVPGFDPQKDKRGLISALLKGGQPQGPSDMNSFLNTASNRFAQAQAAPGGVLPPKPPVPSDYRTDTSIIDRLNPFVNTRQIRQDDLVRFAGAHRNFTAQQAQAAAAQQRTQRSSDATQYGLSGRDALSFINSGEVPDAKVVNSGDSVFVNGGYQQAPGTFSAEENALGQLQSFNNVTGQFGDAQGPIAPVSVSDGANLVNPVTGDTVHTNPKNFAPQNNGITVLPDGTVQVGGAAGAATTRYQANQDAAQLADARDKANQLVPVLNAMYAARAELLGADGIEGTEDDLDTGSYAPYIQAGRRLLPGEQDNETRYDNLDALSKEFGIEKLAGIGGNDTERELITAIQTGPNMGAQEGSNLSRLNRQIATFEFIGESRRNFMSRWQADHGSNSRIAQSGPYKGMTFDEALSVYQRQMATEKGLLGASQSGQTEAGASVGVTTQEGDLTVEGWTDAKERRRQELLAKQAAGTIR